MKKILILFSLTLFVVLTGCQSQKESNVFQTLNEHIKEQNTCNQCYESLTELMSQETAVYNNLIEQGFDDMEAIKPVVEEGRKLVGEIKTQLASYQDCVLTASLDQKELGTIESDELNQLVLKYHDYETALVKYIEALLSLNEAQQSFYDGINDQVKITTLDERITLINSAIDEANTCSINQQEALEAFNQSYKEYGKIN